MTAPLDLDALDALLAKATPGPWFWNVNLKHRSMQIESSGVPMRETVMDFNRWGMGGARPRLVVNTECGPIMHNADEFAVPVKGREHHADWFRDLDHPDANLIVALRNAAPALVAELRAAREALMCCALPLEVLAATECDVAGKALAPETKAAVMNAVKAIRLTLSRAATGGNSNG